jgi:ABC-2 type transport system permease protein
MEQKPIQLEKIFAIVLAVYVLLTVSFYFLAGEQLRLRDSRGDLELPVADSAPYELCAGMVYEQQFIAKIQRLQSIGVQFGTYYRENAGTVTMELADSRDGSILMSQSFDMASIAEGQLLTVTAPEPIESVYNVPLILRLYSDGQPGTSAAPLVDSTVEAKENFALAMNGEAVAGSLCFTASGQDYIWTGLHYWQFMAAGFAALALFCGVVLWRVKRGKHSYVANALTAVQKYRFLIRQLVSRDFKTKYKRSILGVFWSFLNPLLTMLVQYFVFSNIFKSDIPYFAAYLIIGTVMFNFFSEACGMALTSVLGNAGLITKVYMPKYIYPLTRVMSSMVNLSISLIPLVIVCLVTGVHFKKSVVLTLFFLLCLAIFCLGLGMLLASAMVFFRDVQFLWNVLNMIWMYATPIFYPESILPDNFRIVLQVNPLYYFLRSARMCILDGISPEPFVYFQCMVIALAMLLVGALVFRKTQDQFVLYL